jgi:hypothetical protein
MGELRGGVIGARLGDMQLSQPTAPLRGLRANHESEIDPEKLTVRGLPFVRPNFAEREEINRIIMDGFAGAMVRRGWYAAAPPNRGRP